MWETQLHRVPSGSSLSIALVFHVAAAVALGGYTTSAVWIAAPGAAWLAWRWTHKWSKVALVLLNAIVLTIPPPRGWGSTSGPLAGDSDRVAEPGKPTGGGDIVADHAFPGVILFPEVKDHVTLVPPLPMMRKNLFGSTNRQPLDIPFFGSYWLYKWPSRRLPRTSVTLRGDPDQRTFRSNDRKPMVMEAHQNLGTSISTECCRAIEMTVRNADRYPGSLWVELTLVNTAVAERPSMSLGRAAVTSAPRRRGRTSLIPSETLTFEFPAIAPIRRFDEFSVRFILGDLRKDRSAGVAIERFRLLPR